MDENINIHGTAYPLSEILTRFGDAKMVETACKACHNYGKNYACPPNDLDLSDPDLWLHISVWEQTLSQDDAALRMEEAFLDLRKRQDTALLNLESALQGRALFAGSCWRCNPCRRALGEPCPLPDLSRQSFELLGLNISSLLEELFHLHMSFDRPQSIFSVGGVLHKL